MVRSLWDVNSHTESGSAAASALSAPVSGAPQQVVTSGTAVGDTLNGDTGDDVLSGLGGSDTLSGGDGNDTLYGHSVGASSDIIATEIATGLSAPVAAAAALGDPGYLYVAEKDTGIIWRVDAETGARTAFLDIPDGQFLNDGERGVLGLAFHPDYESNGRFFVYLTDAQGDLQVREYARSAGDPGSADTTFSLVIEIPKQTGFSNHNGGWIGFSPTDGYLYIGVGDGGGGGDPDNNGQNLDVLLAKILRLDVNSDDFSGDATRNYHIPSDNPFVGISGADEIWAYGVRNPWRLAFDPRNGDLYIADVGQGAREEVNFRGADDPGGANFGWRIMEGSLAYNPGPPGTPQPGDPSLVLPVFEYDHSVGSSITGGEVYVGSTSSFVGQYVFADFVSGRIFSLLMNDGAAVDPVDRTSQIVSDDGPLGGVVDFVTGSDGSLHAIGYGGSIWRLDPSNGAEDVADALFGGAGNDTLDGGPGTDYMDGGAGDDTFYIDNAGDNAVEAGGDGYDIIMTTVSYAMTLNVEGMHLLGSALYGVGNLQNNVIFGNAAANELQGLNGDDTLHGGAGIDLLYGNNDNDTLYGDADPDALIGGAGNDILDGGTNYDYMAGGAGDDTYYVDNIGDYPVELSGEGNDTIYASTSYTVTQNVETMYLTNDAPYGVGNAQNNIIYGNDAFNELQGLAGDDTLYGGGDFDLLYGNEDNDGLYGEAGDDALVGGAGNDLLDGGLGVDYLLGGTGDDVYYVDNIGDNPVENSGEGADTIYASTSYTMTLNVETMWLTNGALYGVGNSQVNIIHGNEAANELQGLDGNDTLYGGDANDLLYGNNNNDTLYGDAGDDALVGGAGIDILDGGSGADYMIGGASGDTYYVDSVGDQVVEAAVGGTDVVYASISFTLPNEVENLYLTGSAVYGAGNSDLNWIYGNAGNNELHGGDDSDYLYGGDGDDVIYGDQYYDYLYGQNGSDTLYGGADGDILDGGSGADYMDGGTGDDIYYVRDVGDVVFESAATGGGGYDVIYCYTNYTVTAESEVEELQLLGTAQNAYGNDLYNALVGNDLNNDLRGYGGFDILVGSGGADTLYGGAGADIFAYELPSDSTSLAMDSIRDFEVGSDRIDLSTVSFDPSSSYSFTTSGGSTYVHVDVDGNGADDMLIEVYHVTGLTSADIIWS